MAAVARIQSLERVLPYFIVFPFGYFAYNSYKSVRKVLIHDAKNGKVKQVFVHSWLKQVIFDEIIMKEKALRDHSLRFLEDTVRQGAFQNSALAMWANVVNRPTARTQANGICYATAKYLLLTDEDVKVRLAQMVPSYSTVFLLHFAWEKLLQRERLHKWFLVVAKQFYVR